jgi:hypothetical protein
VSAEHVLLLLQQPPCPSSCEDKLRTKLSSLGRKCYGVLVTGTATTTTAGGAGVGEWS